MVAVMAARELNTYRRTAEQMAYDQELERRSEAIAAAQLPRRSRLQLIEEDISALVQEWRDLRLKQQKSIRQCPGCRVLELQEQEDLRPGPRPRLNAEPHHR